MHNGLDKNYNRFLEHSQKLGLRKLKLFENEFDFNNVYPNLKDISLYVKNINHKSVKSLVLSFFFLFEIENLNVCI